jgi:anti-sigma B factor antagonist
VSLVTLRGHDRTTIAEINGEIDVSNVEEVRRALLELPNLAHGLVLDLSGVGYLDSTAISLLHDVAQRLQRRGQRMVVVCPPGATPRRVIELTGLSSSAPVLDGLAEALEMLSVD